MAAVKQQKHLSVSFTFKTKIIPLECRHIKSSISTIIRTVQSAKTRAITPLLSHAKAHSCCHLLSRNSKTLKFKRPL